jgi:hypothetical protein
MWFSKSAFAALCLAAGVLGKDKPITEKTNAVKSTASTDENGIRSIPVRPFVLCSKGNANINIASYPYTKCGL